MHTKTHPAHRLLVIELHKNVFATRRNLINSFTLRASLESIFCYFHNFEKNFGIKQKFTEYLKKSCCLASDRHFSFKYFPRNAFVRKILPILSGLFWLL